MRGAAVRLAPWQDDQPIVLTEGVEDGLAVLRGLPEATPWAALGAANTAQVVLPERAEIILALDCDDAGRQGTALAAEVFRRQGLQVRIAAFADGCDPNDVLLAPEAIRRVA